MKKDIAITIQNYVQYQSLEPVLDEFKKKNYSFDIYVPIAKDPWGLDKMFDEIYEELISLGYKPKRKVSKTKYKILMEPYPMDYYFKIDHKYRLKYKYGAITSKPNPCLKPSDNIYFDGIFCVSDYEANYLSVYSKPYVVGNLKFVHFKHKKMKTKKKVLLYLPTYGDLNSIQMCADELSKLKDKYYIITKSHHGTNYFDYEENNEEKLETLFDEHYSSKESIVELLEKADVVLSDNSGSISEAICAQVPVAIIAKDINPALGSFNSFQYDFVEKGYIPYSSNPKDLEEILMKAQSKDIVSKQRKLYQELFPIRGKQCVEKFMNIIDQYMNDQIDMKYYQLHHILMDDYLSINQKNMELENKYKVLERRYKEQQINMKLINEELYHYRHGKLYQWSKKLYAIKNSRK